MIMFEYLDYAYCIGIVLVISWSIYVLCTRKYKSFELSNFATIAILLFALPRLMLLLLLIVCGSYTLLETFKVELTLGVSLLIIRCVHEINRKLNK